MNKHKKLLALLISLALTVQIFPQSFAAYPPSEPQDVSSDTIDAETDRSGVLSEQSTELPPEDSDSEDAPDASDMPEALDPPTDPDTPTDPDAPADTDAPTDPDDPDTPAEPEPEPPHMDAFILPDDTPPACSFDDVAAQAWYYPYVAYTYTLGLVTGRSETAFRPDATITVAEAICLAVRIRLAYNGEQDTLNDPDAEVWYQAYIDYAAQSGMLPDGITSYNVPCTRRQAAAIFYAALAAEELPAINEITEIPDMAASDAYFAQTLALYNAGILTGVNERGCFYPLRTIKRSEFVSLLYKLILPAQRVTLQIPVVKGMDAFDLSYYDLTTRFTDVLPGAWYYNYVCAQNALCFVQGYPDDTFRPSGNVTLAQAVTVAVRIYQKYNGITTGIPAAAEGENWYEPAVRLARSYNILPQAWTDYNAALSRVRLARLIYNTLPAAELAAINEIEEIPDMAINDDGYAQVLALYRAGVLTGQNERGDFTPAKAVTRAEYTAMLTRLIVPAQREHFTLKTTPIGEKIVYGHSGRGRELCAYQYGDGKNVMVVGFAIHGFEDAWARDAQELVNTAHSLMADLEKDMSTVINRDWTVYVLPLMNPDGLNDGYTNNGPGRCTTTYYKNGVLSSEHGIDMNRSFPSNFRAQYSQRNYTSASPLACAESQALASFVRSVKGSGKNICIDTHGWMQQIITSSGTGGTLYRTFKNVFPGNTYANCTYAAGYFTAYTTALGYDSCLFEFPSNVYSHNQFLSSGYAAKYISCIKTLLSRY